MSSNTYQTLWVDSTRASRATASFRPLGRFQKWVSKPEIEPAPKLVLNSREFAVTVGEFKDNPEWNPKYILFSSNLVLLVDADSGTRAWDLTGSKAFHYPSSSNAFTSREGVFIGGREIRPNGSHGAKSLLFGGAGVSRVWATQTLGERWLIATVDYRYGSGEVPRSEHLFLDTNRWTTPAGSQWEGGGFGIENTRGVGAIFPNGQTVFCTAAGDVALVAVPPVTWPKKVSRELPHRIIARLNMRPYEISLGEQHIALLEAPAEWDDESMWSLLLKEMAFHDDWKPPSGQWTWSTRLHVLDRTGRPVQNVPVPVAVTQPPVDGGEGRFWLVGYGVAHVQRGELHFASRSGVQYFGTAFASGELALSAHDELRIIAPDGTVRQSFELPRGEHITTPPAIGADGSVWVATQQGVYFAS